MHLYIVTRPEAGEKERLAGRDLRFMLDGVDISRHLRSVSISFDPDEIVVVNMEVIPDRVTIDTEAQAVLTAVGKETGLSIEHPKRLRAMSHTDYERRLGRH